MTEPQRISSRDNPLLVKLRRLTQDGTSYRRTGVVWVEGEHLCAAAQLRGMSVSQALLSESAQRSARLMAIARHAPRISIVPDVLFAALSTLESPSNMGFVLDAPAPPELAVSVNTLVLDRLQDAGNVGSILRSAAALGVGQVLAIKGTVALWSPKVLRAGMGAHFALALLEGLDVEALQALMVPLIATSSHAAHMLHEVRLPLPVAWVLGHEGQGVSAQLLSQCALTLRIPQPGGEESLNVSAAAAICLYESLRQR